MMVRRLCDAKQLRFAVGITYRRSRLIREEKQFVLISVSFILSNTVRLAHERSWALLARALHKHSST